MASFDFPPLTPDPDPAPLSPTIPLNPPMVGEASPFDHVDGQNRDLILESIRSWVRHELRGWTTAWQEYLVYWLALVSGYLNDFVEAADAYISEHAISGYSWRTTNTNIATTGTTVVTIAGVDTEHRPLIIGDLVSDHSQDIHYGVIVGVVDASHATVQYIGNLRGLVGFGWWATATDIAHGGTTAVVLAAVADRVPQVNDFVVDDSASVAYGKITAVTDATHVTVTYIGTMQGPQGVPGPQGDPGVVQAVVAGTNVTVDSTDPANPVVSASGSGFGVVETIVAGTNVTVDSTDPANPVVSSTGGGGGGTVDSVVAGDNVTVDSTDPANPVVSAGSPGSALVETIVAGTNVTVDSTDPANPVVSATGGGGSGIVESVVAGARIEVDDTDPANPVVSTANGIPLNVFATIDRPDALVDGDAYFDSDLIIPVWSYGGEWRDSDGVEVPPVPVPSDVDNDGGTGPTVVSYGRNPGLLGAGFDADNYVEFDGALYGRIQPNLYAGDVYDLLIRFDGTDWTPLTTDVVDLGDPESFFHYPKVVGLWVDGADLHVMVGAYVDSSPVTYHLTYDGADWTDHAIDPTIASTEHSNIMFADLSYYLRGNYGGGGSFGYTPDLTVAPTGVDFPSVQPDAQQLGNTLIGWANGDSSLHLFTGTTDSGSLTSPAGYASLSAIRNGDGINQAVVYRYDDGTPGSQIYFALSDEDGGGLLALNNGIGFTQTGRVWVADASDPLGNHVSFRLNTDGVYGDGVYLNGHAYVRVPAGAVAYLVKIAVGV